MKTKSTPKWETVGHIDVDAGLCWLGDPWYWYGTADDAVRGPVKTWDEFCAKLHPETGAAPDCLEWAHPGGHSTRGMGVTVRTGFGDGSYPVQVLRKEGRVKEVRVRFF